MPIDTPVVFIIFRRPDTTQRVFEAIREAQPEKLFIVADGPCADHTGEKQKCQTARNIVADIDWDCEVHRNYSEENLGCKRRVSSGLDWVFDQVSEAIILEDDCLPHPSFFRYCGRLLDSYRHDARVMHINGNNYGSKYEWCDSSYLFGSYPHVWGWATWRRAWSYYDVCIDSWNEFRESGLIEGLDGQSYHHHSLRRRWDKVQSGSLDTWDYQWQFAVMSQNGLAASPRVNLISNIGYSSDATHTTNRNSEVANLPVDEIDSPISHPSFVFPDPKVNQIYRQHMLGDDWRQKVSDAIRSFVKS